MAICFGPMLVLWQDISNNLETWLTFMSFKQTLFAGKRSLCDLYVGERMTKFCTLFEVDLKKKIQ